MEKHRYDTAFHTQKIMFSSHHYPNRESHKKDSSLNLPQKQESETKLKRSQGKENWAGFRSRSIKRDKLKLISVNAEWQAAPGVMSCTQIGSEAGDRRNMGPSQTNEAGP